MITVPLPGECLQLGDLWPVTRKQGDSLSQLELAQQSLVTPGLVGQPCLQDHLVVRPTKHELCHRAACRRV